jgi:hypothetical protein
MKLLIVLTLIISLSAEAAIHRDSSVKAQFQKRYPCPSTGQARGACPGYVKDHIIALACGGVDSVENMQWQTIAEGKAKDKWERNGCKTSKK